MNKLICLHDYNTIRILGPATVKHGDFTLKSGQKSNIYFDIKSACLTPGALRFLGVALSRAVRWCAPNINRVGGMAEGAIPLISAFLYADHMLGCAPENNTPGFWVRKAGKEHGISDRIVGEVKANDRVVLLEDVCTTGESVFEAAHILHMTIPGVVIVGAVVVLDRGGAENLIELGCSVASLATADDFKAASEGILPQYPGMPPPRKEGESPTKQ